MPNENWQEQDFSDNFPFSGKMLKWYLLNSISHTRKGKPNCCIQMLTVLVPFSGTLLMNQKQLYSGQWIKIVPNLLNANAELPFLHYFFFSWKEKPFSSSAKLCTSSSWDRHIKIHGLTVLRKWWITLFFPTIQILGKPGSCLDYMPTSFHAISGQLLLSSTPSRSPWQMQKQQAAPANVLLLHLIRFNQTPAAFQLCVSAGLKVNMISKQCKLT